MQELYFAALILIVIVVIYFILTWHNSTFEDYFYGLWTAEGDDFCEESEIDSMILFVGKEKRPSMLSCGFGKNERKCYLIILNDIDAQGLTLEYRTGWAHIGLSKYHVSADVKFEDEQIWPDQVEVVLDIRKGSLHIYSEKTTYAKLYKQNDISAMSAAMENSELVDVDRK